MKRLTHVVVLAALIAATASCGDVVRQGHAPVFLVVDMLQAAQGDQPDEFFTNLLSDVITNVTSPAPCTPEVPCPTYFNDVGQVTLRIVPKDIGTPTVPSVLTTNNEVTIRRFRVTYRRSDGRNTPGVDVPYGFDGAVDRNRSVRSSADARIRTRAERRQERVTSGSVNRQSNHHHHDRRGNVLRSRSGRQRCERHRVHSDRFWQFW